MAYIPGSALQYHVFLNNAVPLALGRELAINSEMARGKSGAFTARYDDINTVQLALRARLHRTAINNPAFLASVVDLTEGV